MRARSIISGITLVVMLAACSSAAPTTPGSAVTAAPGSTAAPAATAAPGATAAPAITNQPAATIAPTLGPVTTPGPLPSFAGDPELAAQFPTQVDGQPVTGVTTARIADFFAAFQAPQDTIDKIKQELASIGIDFNTVVIGLGSATVAESQVEIQAIRVPGHDANIIIQNYLTLGLSSDNEGDTLTQETVGGKSASVVRDSGGYASTFMYAHGDVLWSVNTSDQNEAAAVFTALP